MQSVSNLIPELGSWNDGQGISPEDWIWIEWRGDHALAYCTMLWPELVEFEDYVFRAPFDIERLRGWESFNGITRQQVETAMNAVPLERPFPQDQANQPLKEAQCERLANIMADMLGAKLARDFPSRRFLAFVMTGEDFGVTFHQI